MEAMATQTRSGTVALSVGDLRRWVLLFKTLLSFAAFPGELTGCVPLKSCVETFYALFFFFLCLCLLGGGGGVGG